MRPGRLLKRLFISIVLGFAIPLAYAIGAALLFQSQYVTDPQTIHLLWLPIGWPRYLFYYLVLTFQGPPRTSEFALMIFMIVCNTIPYAVLTFAALSLRSSRKRVLEVPAPPPPTGF